jgi:hypothetical protein
MKLRRPELSIGHWDLVIGAKKISFKLIGAAPEPD